MPDRETFLTPAVTTIEVVRHQAKDRVALDFVGGPSVTKSPTNHRHFATLRVPRGFGIRKELSFAGSRNFKPK